MNRPHPLTRRERKRLRGIRWRRWLAALLVGVLIGVTGTLAVQWAIQDEQEVVAVTAVTVDQSPDMSVQLSGGLLTALIREEIEQGESPVPLEDVRVVTTEGKLVVRGDVVALRRAVGGFVEMEPVVEDGRLRLRVRRAKLGPLPVPNNIECLAERPINARLAAATGGLPAAVTSARVTDDGLLVTARVRVGELRALPGDGAPQYSQTR